MPAATCSRCGRPVDLHDRHVRFNLPDTVLNSPDREQAEGTWLSHDTPRESVMMRVPELGAFVRALLEVRLTDDHMVTFGVWIAIDPDELSATFDIWWEPEYQQLRLAGTLANTVQPWGLLDAPVQIAVRDPDATPYCETSTDDLLSRVLAEEWDHELVLSALADI